MLKYQQSRGWFVNVPDYEGPLASFSSGIQSGLAVLDSIRAAFSFEDLGLDTDALLAMWGYSGGSFASEWAAEMSASYAPELNFSGVALGGLVPNGTSIFLTINEGPYVGLWASALIGISSQLPEYRAWLLSRLKTEGPHNMTGLLMAGNLTLNQSTVYYAYQDIGDYFVDGITDALGPYSRKVNDIYSQMGYHGVPRMPVYIYKAIADEISVVADADKVVDRYCEGK